MEGRKGEKQTAVREMNLELRPFPDELITQEATGYIKRTATEGKPFCTYIALSHFHHPSRFTPPSIRPTLPGWANTPT